MSRKNKKRNRPLSWIIPIVLIFGVGAWLFIHFLSFDGYEVLSGVTRNEQTGGKSLRFGSHLVRYTNNGIFETDSSGKVIWSASYEMKNPAADLNGKMLAVADIGGNRICLFDHKGPAGDITTKMPIQSVSVSEKGVVAAVIRNDERTMFEIYDRTGMVLVESTASMSDSGYPLAIDLSDNGQKLLVSYLKVGGKETSVVVCYDFGDAQAADTQKKVMEVTYEGTVIPQVMFLGNDAAAVGTDRLAFFSLGNDPGERRQVELDGQVKSVLTDGKGLGIVLRNNSGESPFTFFYYGSNGHASRKWPVNEEYSTITMTNRQVIMINDTSVRICRIGGHVIYEGDFETPVTSVLPAGGYFRYQVLRNDAAELIRLK